MSSSVHGHVARGFESIREAFANGQSTDIGGAQLAVYRHGEKVVDLWTGDDPVRGRPFPEDGLISFMSTTKGITAIVAHLLVQRGLLDIDAPVSKYWPEFAQNGKEKITTRMFLNHTSGLAAVPAEKQLKVADLADWNKIIGWMEEMPPFWEPGTAYFYHSFSFGYLIGEVVRRITGKTIGTYFRDEIATPLGLDLYLGLPEELEDRVVPWTEKTPLRQPTPAAVTPAPPPFDLSKLPMDAPLAAAIAVVRAQDAHVAPFMNSRLGHVCEIPAGNGIGDARSLAKLYAALLGPVDGHDRLLNEQTLASALVPQTDNLKSPPPFDLIPMKYPLRFSLGFDLYRPGNAMLGPSSFGHPGAGGRLAFADPESGFSVGYVCNNPCWEPELGPDPRWVPWLDALRAIAASGKS